ncbi:glycosyl transferase [Rhodobacterales bacterium HKCCE2091]|nr:glycosyl transferase [Rhodobacterales bacterium HKCCE2091]
MAQIAFLLLCHKDAPAVIAQARRLVRGGARVAIHFDGRSPAEDYASITAALKDDPGVAFPARRARCGWGEWSLVEATLLAAEAALAAFPEATHLFMLSGDCMPVKSAAYAEAMLDPGDRDYIESFDFHSSDWIRTGLKRDRLVYRHFFNERRNKRLFYASLELQRRLGLERAVPGDLQVMIGSQWWCLRRRTVEAVLDFIRTRPDVLRFFRSTWIPDETFFQTLVRHLVPDAEIENRSLTFKLFSDYGMPVNFYNDHYDLLLAQDYLFARKISPGAEYLKAQLGALWDSDRTDFAISGQGDRIYRFLTGRGRIGRRFAPRFWEREATLGRDRHLVMIVCKKWHVAKRLLHAAEAETGTRGIEYLFDEQGCVLPDLGGIERNLDKRNRHRRALMRMLFDYYGTDRIMICLDPNNLDLMQDFTSDRADATILEIVTRVDDDYLVGHAGRVGLTRAGTPAEVIDRLLPTLRYDFAYESERIREAEFPNHLRLVEGAGEDANAAALAAAFGIGPEAAQRLARLPHLFAD